MENNEQLDLTAELGEREDPLAKHVLRLSGEVNVLKLFVGVLAMSDTNDAKRKALCGVLDNFKQHALETKDRELAEAIAVTADNLKFFLSVGRD